MKEPTRFARVASEELMMAIKYNGIINILRRNIRNFDQSQLQINRSLIDAAAQEHSEQVKTLLCNKAKKPSENAIREALEVIKSKTGDTVTSIRTFLQNPQCEK